MSAASPGKGCPACDGVGWEPGKTLSPCPACAPARKDDGGKARWDLLPFDALNEVAEVLRYGAAKYAPRNWEKGMDHGRLLGAALRHLSAYAMGRDADEESGLPHLAHATCCCLMLLASCKRGIGRDDRAWSTPPR